MRRQGRRSVSVISKGDESKEVISPEDGTQGCSSRNPQHYPKVMASLAGAGDGSKGEPDMLMCSKESPGSPGREDEKVELDTSGVFIAAEEEASQTAILGKSLGVSFGANEAKILQKLNGLEASEAIGMSRAS